MADNDTISINGASHDWASVTITGPQGMLVGITEINWKSSQKKKRTYGKGLLPRGAARSNYEAPIDFTVDTSEYQDLVGALDAGIYDSVFNLTIVSEPEGGTKNETVLKGIMIDSKDQSAKDGDEELNVKLTGTAAMIVENGKPEYEEK